MGRSRIRETGTDGANGAEFEAGTIWSVNFLISQAM